MELGDYGIDLPILRRMYEEWKEGAPKSELERRIVVLARSRCGVIPLYWAARQTLRPPFCRRSYRSPTNVRSPNKNEPPPSRGFVDFGLPDWVMPRPVLPGLLPSARPSERDGSL